MRKLTKIFFVICLLLPVSHLVAFSQQGQDLRVVMIRHGEKPESGDNLSCKGYNRAVRLADVVVKKFGIPDLIFIPSVSNGKSTKSARMLETVWPIATKYNLKINSKFDVLDKAGLANSLLANTGLILVVWEHHNLPGILKKLGISDKNLDWPDSDFDSIWIVTVHKGKITFEEDKQGINPSGGCPF
jgi:hypothetical protein